MPGGGSKTQTQNQTSTQTNDPWAPAVPAVMDVLNSARGLWTLGAGGGVYGGDRTAGLGSTTQAGLDLTKANASAGQGAAQAGNTFLTGLLGGGGTTPGTSAMSSGLAAINPNVNLSGVSGAAAGLSGPGNVATKVGADMAGGAYATDTTNLKGLADSFATGPSQTRTSLQKVADGAFLNGSPQLDALVGRSEASAAQKVAQQFAASGRYGSGRFAGAVADAVDGVGTNLRYTDLQNERTRQVQAAQAIDAADVSRAGTAGSLYQGLAGINTGNASLAATGASLTQNALKDSLAAQTALAGLQGDNANRSLAQAGTLLSSAQADRAAGLAGLGAVSTNNANLLQPGQTLAGIGAIEDAARQDDINADMQRFNEANDSEWNRLAKLAGVVLPVAGLGGTSSGTATTVTKTPQPSFLQQLLGTALAGANVASKFYGAGS